MARTQVKLQIKVGKKNPAAIGTMHQFSWFNPCKAPPPIPSPGEGSVSLSPRPGCLWKHSKFKSLSLPSPEGPVHSTALSIPLCYG